MKIKVILLMHFPPKLDLTNSGFIELPNGEKTCFNNDKQNWFFALGNQMMNRYADKLDVEIWQPEPKTKEIILRKYNNGLIHRLFPACYINKLTITGTKKKLFSDKILSELKKESTSKNIVLHFRATREYFTSKIVNIFDRKIIYLGQFSINITNRFNVNDYSLFKKYYVMFRVIIPYKKFLLNVNNIIPGTQKDLKAEPFFNKLNIFYRDNCANFGLDVDFWDKDKVNVQKVKKNMGLDNYKILLVSSRLVKEKRIVEIINAISKIKTKIKYKLIITGSFNTIYGEKIKNISDVLIPNRVIFTGFVSEIKLRDLFAISDLFISNSILEAGPFSVYIAYLMEVPVLQTKVGIGYEFGDEQHISFLISSEQNRNEKELQASLEKYFNGELPKNINRNSAINYFNWDTISQYYFDVYNSLIKSKEK